uniref:G protein-coupled receptor n=1 Tax=Haemonchus contortus TaxID=6289 RepID=A0A7I4Y304_HAECO
MRYMPNTTIKFPTPSAARTTYTLMAECICCIACVMNILLFLAFSCRPLKTRSYNYFFILSIVQNLVSAITFFLMAPEATAFNSVLLIISTGRGGDWMIGPFIILLYSTTFVSSMIFVTNNFVHKYFLIYLYASPKWLLLIGLINIAVVVNWIAMNVYCEWPSKEFVRGVRYVVTEYLPFDISRATFMGISITYGLSTSRFILLVEALVLVLAIGFIGLSFAMYIHIHLAHVKMMSNQTRYSHQQLLMVLLL